MEDADLSVKQDCRQRVMDHLIAHHAGETMRLLSFPSAHWRFELGIRSAFNGDVFCSAVERDPMMFRIASNFLPGNQRIRCTEYAENGRVDVTESESARIALCEMSAMMEFVSRSCGRVAKEQTAIARRWKTNTAIWMDFNSQICREVENVVPRLSTWCARDRHVVPVALTFMGARETPDVGRKVYLLDTDRIGYAKALLMTQKHRRFEHDSDFVYNSNGTKMVTIMGRLVLP